MSRDVLTETERQTLVALDTPTVCNALELLVPKLRSEGFTVQPLICSRPGLPPMVGYAKTCLVRAAQPPSRGKEQLAAQRVAYYEYVEQGPRPTVAVVQDIDSQPGFGAFWGEVNSNIHKGLGCIGTVTNGSIRDLDVIAEGFQMLAGLVGPSHGWIHLEDFATDVSVRGMVVRDGDLIHADHHGAVVIPHEVAREVPEAAALIARREGVILKAAKKRGFTVEALKQAMGEAQDIH